MAALLTMPSAGRTADTKGRYAVDGAGRATCTMFLDARAKKGEQLRTYAGWIDGYITGFNHFQRETYDLTPWQTTELMIVKLAKYCKTAPDTRFNDALNLLAQALYDNRLRGESEIVQLRAGGQAVLVYRSLLRRIHTALIAAGYKAGGINDSFTEDIAQALRDYQSQHKLPVSGLPDQLTLNALFPQG